MLRTYAGDILAVRRDHPPGLCLEVGAGKEDFRWASGGLQVGFRWASGGLQVGGDKVFELVDRLKRR
jgi:hypothetical protein